MTPTTWQPRGHAQLLSHPLLDGTLEPRPLQPPPLPQMALTHAAREALGYTLAVRERESSPPTPTPTPPPSPPITSQAVRESDFLCRLSKRGLGKGGLQKVEPALVLFSYKKKTVAEQTEDLFKFHLSAAGQSLRCSPWNRASLRLGDENPGSAKRQRAESRRPPPSGDSSPAEDVLSRT